MAVAEIISIGTELLLGQILNTNSKYLSEELAALGINCFYQVTVGDNKDRMKETLRQALDRSDVVITTGGLGPTADDLTIECIAEFFGAQMEFDAASLEKIEGFFKRRGVPMPETNRKQAYRPVSSTILPNPRGTAPGIIWKLGADLLAAATILDPFRPRYILTFPGVPSEMEAMWKETAVPYLQAEFGEGTLWSCELKHYGIGESALAEKYAHLLGLVNPTVAPYAGTGECRLRVTAKATNADEARAIAQPVLDEIVRGSGVLCYGRDGDTLEGVVGALLAQQGLTISAAESCTGGLFSKRLTDVAGSSRYVNLNVVTYANEAKHRLLGVPEEVLNGVGAVSAECAEAMAAGVLRLGGADVGIGITGIAGPEGGTDDKPVGLVYIGMATKGADKVEVARMLYPPHSTRSEIRFRTASDALNMVRLYLAAREPAKC